MTAIEELKRDPLAFLRHYALALDMPLWDPKPPHLLSDGTVRVTLRDDSDGYTPHRPRNRVGLGQLMAKFGGDSERSKATKRFTVKWASAGDAQALHCYIAPYILNSGRVKTLGTKADIMFTAEMSGCSFAVGSPSSTGAQSVMHTNASDSGQISLQQQSTDQHTMAGNALGQGTIFEPSHYRNSDKERATVMGIRKGYGWRFYAQRFVMTTEAGLGVMDVVRIG
ncbi:hypothetical protein VQH23_15020 [Pararoseomonas sp. SCSIO 73927]|uniref:hypothetical protein n=1 Tax=Pararoseomonas sp. SCSIO 73927 TaxID=3114537 RepID=UPI0030CDD80B